MSSPSAASCVLVATLLWLAMPLAWAQGGTVLVANGQYDEEGAYALNAGVDHAFSDATWLRFAAGLAEAAEDPVSLSTQHASLGLDHYFDPAGVALDAGYWGDDGTIETLSVAGELYFRGERSRFGLDLSWRGIELSYEVPSLVANLVADSHDFKAVGLGGSYRHSWSRNSLYVRAMHWDYDEQIGDIATTLDLSRVPLLLRPQVLQRLARLVNAVRLLSASSLTLANNLLAHSASIGFDQEFGEHSLNLEVTRDRAEVDDLDVTSVSAAWLFPVGRSVDLEMRLGWSDADTFGSSAFGGLTLFVYR